MSGKFPARLIDCGRTCVGLLLALAAGIVLQRPPLLGRKT